MSFVGGNHGIMLPIQIVMGRGNRQDGVGGSGDCDAVLKPLEESRACPKKTEGRWLTVQDRKVRGLVCNYHRAGCVGTNMSGKFRRKGKIGCSYTVSMQFRCETVSPRQNSKRSAKVRIHPRYRIRGGKGQIRPG